MTKNKFVDTYYLLQL